MLETRLVEAEERVARAEKALATALDHLRLLFFLITSGEPVDMRDETSEEVKAIEEVERFLDEVAPVEAREVVA